MQLKETLCVVNMIVRILHFVASMQVLNDEIVWDIIPSQIYLYKIQIILKFKRI